LLSANLPIGWLAAQKRIQNQGLMMVSKKYPTIEAACFGVAVAVAVVFDFDLPPFETM